MIKEFEPRQTGFIKHKKFLNCHGYIQITTECLWKIRHPKTDPSKDILYHFHKRSITQTMQLNLLTINHRDYNGMKRRI